MPAAGGDAAQEEARGRGAVPGRAVTGRAAGGRGWGHQEVEVARPEQALVQVAQLDHHLLMEAQRPAFVTEEQPAVRQTCILLEALQELFGR